MSGSDPVAVRPAASDDAEGVRRVARAAWHAAYDDILGADTVDETIDEWYAPDAIGDDVDREDRPFFVAGADRVRGFAVASPRDRDGVYSLYRIYVHPDDWGEGIGTALLERTETACRERGADRLRLSTFAGNDVAVGFYDSRGFERVRTTHDDAWDERRFVFEKRL